MSYNPHIQTTNSGACDLVVVNIFSFEKSLVVVLSGWQSNWLCCYFCDIEIKEKINQLLLNYF